MSSDDTRKVNKLTDEDIVTTNKISRRSLLTYTSVSMAAGVVGWREAIASENQNQKQINMKPKTIDMKPKTIDMKPKTIDMKPKTIDLKNK